MFNPPKPLRRVMKALRYVVIFCSVGWAGAAAAYQMWGAMIFFLAYLIAIYVSGVFVDRYFND